jgi:hypothetical protein
MWKPEIAAPEDANGNKDFTTDIGLVFFLDQREPTLHLGHGGDQNGFISYIDFEPKKRAASIMVFNTNILLPDNTPPEKDMVSKLRKGERQLFASIE